MNTHLAIMVYKVFKILQALGAATTAITVLFDVSPCIHGMCVRYYKTEEYCATETRMRCINNRTTVAVTGYFRRTCMLQEPEMDYTYLFNKVNIYPCYLPPVGPAITLVISLLTLLIYVLQCTYFWCSQTTYPSTGSMYVAIMGELLWVLTSCSLLYTQLVQLSHYLEPLELVGAWIACAKAFHNNQYGLFNQSTSKEWSHSTQLERFAKEWTEGRFQVQIDHEPARNLLVSCVVIGMLMLVTLCETLLAKELRRIHESVYSGIFV